jgi:AAA domain/Toprim domain
MRVAGAKPSPVDPGNIAMTRPRRTDVYELVAGRQLEILRSLGIEWNLQRSRHVHCPYPDHTDANPSWRWDHDRGMAHCTCGHTDIFGVVMRVKNLGTGREAWQAAADYCRTALGETPGREDARTRRSSDGYDPDRYLRVLLRSGPGEGTFADLYLRSRGIALSPWPDALRFNPSTYCKGTNSHLPAVIALMGAAPDAEPTSVFRIYLSADGKAKAAITEPKLLLGRPLAGKAVWLGEPGERVIITEGVEDAAACLIAGETFAAAGIGDNTANIVLPTNVREAVIFADRDADDKGIRIAEKLAERLRTEGRRVLIALAPEPYKDANELLIKQGANAVGRAIEAAGAYVPKATAPEWWREETVSGTDLQTRIFPALRFVVPGLMPEGLVLLAGKPKAKKSWLALDVAIAATADRFTLGEIKPDQGDVLYLALEDSLRRVQRRMTKLLGMQKWPSRLLIKTTWKRVDQGGLDGIAAWAKSVERPTMVVVDTLERVRPMPSPSSKATPYSLDYAALTGLQQIAAELQIAILVITHVRKATADDVFDTISGTLGLTAAADTILVLGPKNGVMSLCVRGRDIEESEKAVQWNQNTCRWTITGDTPHDAPKSDSRGHILAALAAAGRAMSVDEVTKATGFKNRDAADKMLQRMFKEMEIDRPSRGMYEAKLRTS